MSGSYGYGNGGVSSVHQDLRPSLVSPSTHYGPASIASGRSRSDSGMSGNNGYGGYGNSDGSIFHQHRRTMRTAILEPRTSMSTSSIMAPVPENEDSRQANADLVHHGNMRLMAVIREQNGIENDDEADAIISTLHMSRR
ncbi:hypothetical protein BGX23_010674 [Mortierella sp. AD031]|nr:hypothetical protein BGX23_010674 [Mortierella sp. AD031]KAG0198846.1 hypothetical protein BGX33_012025 [Mortierella sp. NVP41]